MTARRFHIWLRLIAIAIIVTAIILIAGKYIHSHNLAVLTPAGPVARQERSLMIVALALMAIVVVPVYVLTFGFAWHYRAGNTKAKYSPNLDRNAVAETAWWLVPAALIGVLSVMAWTSSHALDPAKPLAGATPPLTVDVVALDWKWLFIYPQQHIASVNLLQIPVGTPVAFNLTADAPMNSFWIPQLGGQIYAMPGMSTQLHLMADHAGNYHGVSANISGAGFAGMEFTARASTAAAFNRWVTAAQNSHRELTSSAYATLSQPSSNVAAQYYANPPATLYNDIVMKYMPSGASMSMTAGGGGMAQ